MVNTYGKYLYHFLNKISQFIIHYDIIFADAPFILKKMKL